MMLMWQTRTGVHYPPSPHYIMNSSALSLLNKQLAALLGATVLILIGLLIVSLIIKVIVKVFFPKIQKPSLIIANSSFLAIGYVFYAKNILFSSSSIFPQKILGVIYPLIGLLCVQSLWGMKKRGLIGLISLVSCLQVLHIFMHIWTPLSLFYFIPILPMIFYFKKMN